MHTSKQTMISLYRLLSSDKLFFFWLMKVNKFPFKLECVNTQADISLNLAALFVCVLADVNNKNTFCSHSYIFGSRASFYFCCSAQRVFMHCTSY